jgi:hypothetical protein
VVAKLRSPAFGKGFGGVGVVAASVLLVDPLSPSAIVGFLALIVFQLVLGWKFYNLSRALWGVLRIGEKAGALKTIQEGNSGNYESHRSRQIRLG